MAEQLERRRRDVAAAWELSEEVVLVGAEAAPEVLTADIALT